MTTLQDIKEIFKNTVDEEDEEEYKSTQVYQDDDEETIRISIDKSEINFTTVDWSTKFAGLKDMGYCVTGITTDRYPDNIYIWVDPIR